MNDDLQRIRHFVRRLVKRARLLLVLRALIQGLAVLLGLWGWALVAMLAGIDRPLALFVLICLGGIGMWFAVASPLIRGWRATGDHLAQARRVEALLPALRGRLLTVAARQDGARAGESEAMLARVARRAHEEIEWMAVHRVHPSGRLLVLGGAVALGWMIALPASFLAPGGPMGMAGWWMAGGVAEAVAAHMAFPERRDYATVGDLTIRYVYPAYTGLDPKEIPNSTGDVRGPPGTQVQLRARTADPVDAAGLVAYEERLEARIDAEGRQVEAELSIAAESGAYHLLLYRGAEPERSRDFAVEAEPDLAPEVMLESAADPIRVAVDMPFEVQWRARDDYGISRVQLLLGGESRPDPLYVAEARRAEASGILRTTPQQLGLQAGDALDLSVVAWDNDTVSGRKAGYSRPIRLEVLGARGMQERVAERQAELLELLVPILAAQLTDPWPPGGTSGEVARWGEVVSRRYEPLEDAVDRLWRSQSADSYDASLIQSVLDRGTQLVRYTQVAFVPRSSEIPSDEAYQATAELREAAITSLEDAVLFLLDVQHLRALAEAADHARSVAQVAQSMKEMLAEDEPDAQQMLVMLDQLERMMAQLAEQAQQLGEGGLQEFLNQRVSEVDRLTEEVREALAQGDLERARELMERLARQLEDLAQGVQDELERREQQSDDLMAELDAVDAALQALEQEQRQLQAEVADLREQADAESSSEARALWEEVEQKSRAAFEAGQRYTERIPADDQGRRSPFIFNEQQRARAAVDETLRLYEAAVARDLRGARAAVFEADTSWLYAQRSAEQRAGRGGVGPTPGEAAQIRVRLEEIGRLLDALSRLSQQTDPGARAAAEALEQRQEQLERELEQVAEQARQLEQRLPVRPEGMKEALEDAEIRMEQASGDLGQGQLMQAEGSQGSAAERVADAREALHQARQQMQEQAQQMQGGGEPDQGDGEEQDGDASSAPAVVEIPGREEFRTPEEYRRALLEGMEGEVPEEYRALKKRYFEELVHQ